MRRLANVIALALITGTLVPAVTAAAPRPQDAARPQGTPSSQGFGVQLADVPAAEVANPRALRYIIDYLPGTMSLAHGPANMSAGPFRAQQIITLAPGQSGNVTFALGRGLPDGRWQAAVTLTSGITSVTARAVIQFSAVTVSHPGPGLAFWAIGALGVIVAALIVIVIVAGRARRWRRASA